MARRTEYRVLWRRPSWRPNAWNQRHFAQATAAHRWAEKMTTNGSIALVEIREVGEWIDWSTYSPEEIPRRLPAALNRLTLEQVIAVLAPIPGAIFPSPRALAKQLGITRTNAQEIKQEGLASGALSPASHGRILFQGLDTRGINKTREKGG